MPGRGLTLSLTLLAALTLAGCLPVAAGLAGPGLAAGSTAITGKTPVDHAVSAIAGKDCSVVRSRQGLTYCREDEPTLPVTVSCYRTIGDVSCHPRTLAQPGRQRPVDGTAAASSSRSAESAAPVLSDPEAPPAVPVAPAAAAGAG